MLILGLRRRDGSYVDRSGMAESAAESDESILYFPDRPAS